MQASPSTSSTSLSRAGDPSFNSFTPGSHRRSHPNLHHLSFAPLTPKYPISPSDYDAYVDPSTNNLHTSTSLSHIASLPEHSGLLSVPTTPGGSRSPRRGHSRRTQSNIQLSNVSNLMSPKLPSGAVTSAGMGGKFRSGSRRAQASSDPSWLIQTGLLLTDSSRESKGQSWLVKRASSTSLHDTSPITSTARSQSGSGYFTPNPTRDGRGSARVTPAASRRQSRVRMGASKRDLRMTSIPVDLVSSASVTAVSTPEQYKKNRYFTSVQPDWTDPDTLAEALEESINGEPGSVYESADDGEDVSDTEDEQEAEKEIQRQVKLGRGFIFGKWVDGIVDTLMMFEEEEEEDDDELGETAATTPGLEAGELKDNAAGKSGSDRSKLTLGKDSSTDPLPDMEPAPENPASVWEDVKWVGRLVWGTPVL